MSSGTNLFLIVSLLIAGLMVLVAAGTFAYGKLLDKTLAGKQAELAAAQQKVDENTVEEFVRLRDRLSSGKDLLNNHIVLSQFFDDLEGMTLQSVRFNSMKLAVAGDRSAKIEMQGTAKNFNALAAQSNAFAGDKRIKRAIFSGITLKDGLVTFTLTADIDPKLVVENVNRPAPAPTGDASATVPASQPFGTTTPSASGASATTSKSKQPATP